MKPPSLHVLPLNQEGSVLCFDAIVLQHPLVSTQVRPLDPFCKRSLGSAAPGTNAGEPKGTRKVRL